MIHTTKIYEGDAPPTVAVVDVRIGDIVTLLYPLHGDVNAPLIPRFGRVEKVASWGICIEDIPRGFTSFSAHKWQNLKVREPIKVR